MHFKNPGWYAGISITRNGECSQKVLPWSQLYFLVVIRLLNEFVLFIKYIRMFLFVHVIVPGDGGRSTGRKFCANRRIATNGLSLPPRSSYLGKHFGFFCLDALTLN